MKYPRRFFLIFCLSVFCINKPLFAAASDNFQSLKKLVEVFFTAEKAYFKELDLNKCVEATLQRGLSECLDPYSRYLTKEETEEQDEEFKGHFGGIGVRLMGKKAKDRNEIVVTLVLKNTPAEKAGLKAGDVLVAVSSTSKKENQISVRGLPLDETVKLIKGKIGAKVSVVILRENDMKEFIMARADIKVDSVEYKMLNSRVGYLQIVEFGQETEADFQAAASSLSASGMKALIIDLRNNPGGTLGSVLNINSLFAKDFTPFLYTKGRGDNLYTYEPTKHLIGKYKNLKIVVLVNEYSASASEIMAGWLKSDYGAPVVGKKTFGKGSVQALIPLSDGSRLRLTIAEYFIGKDKVKVHEVGISPTIEVENPKELKSEADDLQLKRALQEAEKLLKK